MDGAVGVVVVAEVELADGGVRVMSFCNVVWNQNHLTHCEAVVSVSRRRDWVRYVELCRVADPRGSQEDAAVEERRVVDSSNGQNDVAVGQHLARLPLDDALVCAAHVHHLSYNQQRALCHLSITHRQQRSRREPRVCSGCRCAPQGQKETGGLNLGGNFKCISPRARVLPRRVRS